MNIFVLDSNPVVAAEYLCDKHVVKMILESAQLLSTAHHVLGSDVATDSLYRKTHVNHPCAKWVRESPANYDWLFEHMTAMMNEYTKRYGKQHATMRLLDMLAMHPTYVGAKKELTPHVLCMPDQYKCGNVVESYREFYRKDKSRFATWKLNNVPNWFME